MNGDLPTERCGPGYSVVEHFGYWGVQSKDFVEEGSQVGELMDSLARRLEDFGAEAVLEDCIISQHIHSQSHEDSSSIMPEHERHAQIVSVQLGGQLTVVQGPLEHMRNYFRLLLCIRI